ncbi:minor tail protein [Arthrobacter phage Molivia]|uniref:Minor tail protein n=1 Tax=Arthrobacter phage Molivia TaxID=2015839 RepID=A0A286N4E0_9CAUD|nr:minor tail protein [Arthrobacter phage Molivia]ASX99247.1 minor tail protein [Arthrobacter phage Molivia]
MRRDQIDAGSQPVRNYDQNPRWDATSGSTFVRSNLCWNSSFETNLNGWSGAGVPVTTITRVNDKAKFGTWSMRADCTALNGGAFLNSGRVAAVSGESATLSVWMLGEAGKQMTLESRFLDSAQAILTNKIAPTVTATGDWQRLSVSHIAPANTASVDLVVRNYTNGAHVIYTDGVLIEKHSVLFDYFDGSFAASGDFTYSWTGTAHQTTSNQIAPLPASIVSSGNAPRPVWQSLDRPAATPKFARTQQLITGAALGVNPTDSVHPASITRTNLMWVRCSRSVSADVRYRDPSGANLLVQGTVTFVADQWQLLRVVGAPSFANASLSLLFTTNRLQAGDTVDVGPHMSVPGVYTGDIVDGTKPFSKWDGAANASTSVGYPPQLLSLAGKPLYDITDVGSTTLSGGFGNTEARTIYTVYQNLIDIPDSNVPIILTYGATALNDTIPNQFLTLRQQASSNPGNNLIVRRTGGAGALVSRSLVTPNVATWGIDNTGKAFIQVNNEPTVTDSITMDIPNERIVINAPSTSSVHIRTLIYRGLHDATTRAAVNRYLGNKYGAPVS